MSGRDEKQFDEYSPEISLADGWREFRVLMIKILEDVEERQQKQEISIEDLKKIIMNIQIDQREIKTKQTFISAAAGFIFGVIGYAIQYFFFTK